VAAAVVIAASFLLAVFWPKGPTARPIPQRSIRFRARLFFMWIFAVAALMPEYMETSVCFLRPLSSFSFSSPYRSLTTGREKLAVAVHRGSHCRFGLPGDGHPHLPWLHFAVVAEWMRGASPNGQISRRRPLPLELQGLVVMQNMAVSEQHPSKGREPRGPILPMLAPHDGSTHRQSFVYAPRENLVAVPSRAVVTIWSTAPAGDLLP